MGRADLVLTGGQSLYEAKKHQHRNIHPFPSSVDVAHFGRRAGIVDRPARSGGDPASATRLLRCASTNASISRCWMASPQARPDWHIVMLGPVVKIDPAALPQRAEYPLSGLEVVRRAAALCRRLGRRAAAVRPQ